jgi:hypothetical protein
MLDLLLVSVGAESRTVKVTGARYAAAACAA